MSKKKTDDEKKEKQERVVFITRQELTKYKFEKCCRCQYPIDWYDWVGEWQTMDTFQSRGYHCPRCNKTYRNKDFKGTVFRYGDRADRGRTFTPII